MDETKILETEAVEETEEIEEDEEVEVVGPKKTFGKQLISKDVFAFSVRDIAEMGILCAIAVILDTFVKFKMKSFDAGSISFAMLPLFIITLRQGWFKGFISGAIIFGLLTCVIDGHGFHTYPLDYFVGFGSVAILGVFKPLITDDNYNITWHSYVFSAIGIFAEYVIRFIAATIDGVLFYVPTIGASMIENAPNIFVSFLITCALFEGLLINVLKAFRAHNTKSL